MRAGDAHLRRVREHQRVQGRMFRLAPVIELLADPLADLLGDLARVDRSVEATVQREQQVQLAQVRFHGGRHIRILQFAGEARAILRHSAVHLPERCGGRGREVERGEPVLPLGPEFSLHPSLHEGGAHRRRVGLELAQLGRIFGRQQVRNRREELGDLHQRPLEAAESRREGRGIDVAASLRASGQPSHAHARRDTPDIGAYAGVARGAGGKAVGLVISHARQMGREAAGFHKGRSTQPELRRRMMPGGSPIPRPCGIPGRCNARRWSRSASRTAFPTAGRGSSRHRPSLRRARRYAHWCGAASV